MRTTNMTLSKAPLTRGVVVLAALLTAVAPAMAAPPKSKPTIAVPGELIVVSLTIGATIEIDGKPMGKIPLEDSLVLMPGQHTIKMTKRGYTDYLDTFEILPGAPLELEADLLPFAGIVRITTSEPGATVKIAGKVEGVTPFDKDIPAGKKTIVVSRPDFFDDTRELEIRAGEFYDIDVVLRALPKKGDEVSGGAFYEKWWFWTIVGVAGAGAAAAVIATSGGQTVSPTPQFTLSVP
ncbi:MAG: PEGA domain-containing protein [Deltaproteobacteria bacterium]|nr:PEGA domain-containing protein [Deltaproteobacteria bacterium]